MRGESLRLVSLRRSFLHGKLLDLHIPTFLSRGPAGEAHNPTVMEIPHTDFNSLSKGILDLTYLKSYVILRSIRQAIEVAALFLDMQ